MLTFLFIENENDKKKRPRQTNWPLVDYMVHFRAAFLVFKRTTVSSSMYNTKKSQNAYMNLTKFGKFVSGLSKCNIYKKKRLIVKVFDSSRKSCNFE